MGLTELILGITTTERSQRTTKDSHVLRMWEDQ